MPPEVDLYRTLPLDALEVIDRYLIGLRPGSGFRAILENDLVGVMRCGDEHTIRDLRVIVRYLYNMVPNVAWGTPGKVVLWLAMEPEARERLAERCDHHDYIAMRRQQVKDFVQSCRDNDVN